VLLTATEEGRVTDGKLSLAYGPWAEHAAATLRAGGVTCGVTDSWKEFRLKMVTKLLWSCLFWMMSAGLGGKPVSARESHTQRGVGSLHMSCVCDWCGCVVQASAPRHASPANSSPEDERDMVHPICSVLATKPEASTSHVSRGCAAANLGLRVSVAALMCAAGGQDSAGT
jgi:hypothetical protein